MTTTAVRENQILFKGPMVTAILADRKDQTRRTRGLDRVNANPVEWCCEGVTQSGTAIFTGPTGTFDLPCPYGAPGDRLWVREAFFDHDSRLGAPTSPLTARQREERIEYREDEWDRAGGDAGGGWSPSIHMPRWASRITLEVTDVRVQRLQEINEADAVAEGADLYSVAAGLDSLARQYLTEDTHRHGFAHLWDSLNAKRGYGWDQNPWVWAISFRRLA
jgi:hypothetical protein